MVNIQAEIVKKFVLTWLWALASAIQLISLFKIWREKERKIFANKIFARKIKANSIIFYTFLKKIAHDIRKIALVKILRQKYIGIFVRKILTFENLFLNFEMLKNYNKYINILFVIKCYFN